MRRMEKDAALVGVGAGGAAVQTRGGAENRSQKLRRTIQDNRSCLDCGHLRNNLP